MQDRRFSSKSVGLRSVREPGGFEGLGSVEVLPDSTDLRVLDRPDLGAFHVVAMIELHTRSYDAFFTRSANATAR